MNWQRLQHYRCSFKKQNEFKLLCPSNNRRTNLSQGGVSGGSQVERVPVVGMSERSVDFRGAAVPRGVVVQDGHSDQAVAGGNLRHVGGF